MIRRKLLYLLILAAGIWLCMLYTFRGLRLLLCVWALLPVLCLFSLFLKFMTGKAVMDAAPETALRGERLTLSVTVSNRGILPTAGVRTELRIRSLNGRKTRQKRWLLGIDGRSRRKMKFELPTEHCGCVEAELAKAEIYDCLRLFSIPLRRRGKASVCILPQSVPMREDTAEKLRALFHVPGSRGDGEYFIRDYQPGDSARSIHWKLLPRAEKIPVRDFEPDRSVELYLHLTEALLSDADKKDLFLERAATVMRFLAEISQDGYEVFLSAPGSVKSRRILGPEDIRECLMELVCLEHADDDTTTAFVRGLHLEPDGRLYLGERCVDEE